MVSSSDSGLDYRGTGLILGMDLSDLGQRMKSSHALWQQPEKKGNMYINIVFWYQCNIYILDRYETDEICLPITTIIKQGKKTLEELLEDNPTKQDKT